MKTAALLPTPGDPFLLRHWLRNCEQVWRGEVDEIRLMVGGQPNDEARAYIREHVERLDGVYTERLTGGLVTHGNALGILIEDCDADLVLLLEDDVRVRHGGAIGRSFDYIRADEYDVCASPRVSMSGLVQEACKARGWGEYRRADDWSEGGGMWPAFVFARRSDLLATDRDFGERGWGPGQKVPGLGITLPGSTEDENWTESECADCFGAVAFQLRDKLRVLDQPQWKGPWHWPTWMAEGKDEMMHWFHIGSLSSSNNLVGIDPIFQDGRTLDNDQEIGEWAHRLSWWGRCLTLYGHELPQLAERYAHNLERIRLRMGVPMSAITAWDDVVDPMVTWNET